MNELLARAGGFFLAPEAPRARASAFARAPQLVAVIAAPDDVVATAGAVAAGLRSGRHVRTVVVCRPTEAPPARPAMPAAGALTRRLQARDVPAVAAGAICRVALPADAPGAVRAVWRLVGAVDVPVVLALPGRLDGYDGLLAEADRLYLAPPAGADEGLAGLALASLAALGPAVVRLSPPTGPVARRLAAMGLRAGAGSGGGASDQVATVPETAGGPAEPAGAPA